MKTFDVYKNSDNSYQAVKKGFGWPAFFFTWIWALVKKMWIEGILLLVVAIIINSLDRILNLNQTFGGVGISLLLTLVFCFVVGLNGNKWKRNNLIKSGYEKIDTVAASSRDSAVTLVIKSKNEQVISEPLQTQSLEENK
jgi:hypothetical protein